MIQLEQLRRRDGNHREKRIRRAKRGKKRQRGNKGKGKGKQERAQKGTRIFPPSPDHGDPLVKMQVQMEISKQKEERKSIMDVSKDWFGAMSGKILKENAGASRVENWRTREEVTEKSRLL